MILATHGIIGSGSAFDIDALLFFNRVTSAGGSLSLIERQAVNQLVVDLKSAGIWSSMKAIYPMVGASAAACAQNLKSSSFTGTFTSGFTFASTGVTGNGTSAYMSTGFNPLTECSTNGGCLGYYSRTNNGTLTMAEIGAISTVPNPEQYFQIHASVGGSTYLLPNVETNFISFANNNSSGFFQAFRTSNTTTGGKWNTNSYSSTGTSVETPNFEALVCARNSNGTPNFYSNRECAFAYFGDVITDTQASNFYTAVQAFQTTLGRQV
jgi:hypothetical protein